MHLNIKDLVDKKFQNKNQFAKAIGVGYPAACKLYKMCIRDRSYTHHNNHIDHLNNLDHTFLYPFLPFYF